MMKNGRYLFILALWAAACTGCSSDNNPSGPSSVSTPTPDLTPVAATAQVLWKNGVKGSWWGHAVDVGVAYPAQGSVALATVTDTLTGDTKALVYKGNGAAAPYQSNIIFYFSGASNASNYYSTGHIQYDLMLGPAFGAGNSLWTAYRNPAGACVSPSMPGSGFSATSFTHVSVALAGGFGSCNDTAMVNRVGIGIPGGETVPAGLQYYVNDVEWTPN